MTNHLARLYALVGAVLVFFVAWAAIAAHPWQKRSASAVQDPRLAALQLREQRVRADALAVKRVLEKRWAVYRAQLALRKQEIAAVKKANAKAASLASVQSSSSSSYSAAPAVRVVTLPPLTITRTS